MTKRTYWIVMIVVFLGAALVDVAFPDHHHAHFKYHEWPVFDGVFALVGALILILFSLGLGEIWLWKTICSVILDETKAGFGNKTAVVKELLVEIGQPVAAAEPLVALETDRGKRILLTAPLKGKVDRFFFDIGESVRVGETVVDVQVKGHIKDHPSSQEASHA